MRPQQESMQTKILVSNTMLHSSLFVSKNRVSSVSKMQFVSLLFCSQASFLSVSLPLSLSVSLSFSLTLSLLSCPLRQFTLFVRLHHSLFCSKIPTAFCNNFSLERFFPELPVSVQSLYFRSGKWLRL